jgi:polyisoprenoid-binding protein YceI
VLTFREGLLSPVGHDLVLRVQRASLEVDADRSSLKAQFDPASIIVEAPALSASDRRTIERQMADDVLETRRFPEITFVARIARQDEQATLDGTLALHGRSRPLQVRAALTGGRWRARISLHQPDFGIKPFSAMFGTLRVRADVIVEIAVEDA